AGSSGLFFVDVDHPGDAFDETAAGALTDHFLRLADPDPALFEDLLAGAGQLAAGADGVDPDDGAVLPAVAAGEASDLGAKPGLFLHFANDRLGRRLARFEAAAGKLPVALVAGFDEEDVAGVQDDGERGIA